MPTLGHIIPVVSGKGGVGKSTVAVNLAVALAAQGRSVGLVDADFYGPSVPLLLGAADTQVKPNAEQLLVPAESLGVHFISVALMLPEKAQPLVWRGPMLHKAINQLVLNVAWPQLDYCIVDMPPGTGDAALSLMQQVQVSGALTVTTPQEVALADVRKVIGMLQKLSVPLLGLVENMAGFTSPSGERFDIFGRGGGERLAQEYDTPVLATLPLDPLVRAGGDCGRPAAADPQSPAGRIFAELAQTLQRLRPPV